MTVSSVPPSATATVTSGRHNMFNAHGTTTYREGAQNVLPRIVAIQPERCMHEHLSYNDAPLHPFACSRVRCYRSRLPGRSPMWRSYTPRTGSLCCMTPIAFGLTPAVDLSEMLSLAPRCVSSISVHGSVDSWLTVIISISCVRTLIPSSHSSVG
jgi:hypothetical protein